MGPREEALQYVIDYLKRQIESLDRMGQKPIRDQFLVRYQGRLERLEELRMSAITLDKGGKEPLDPSVLTVEDIHELPGLYIWMDDPSKWWEDISWITPDQYPPGVRMILGEVGCDYIARYIIVQEKDNDGEYH